MTLTREIWRLPPEEVAKSCLLLLRRFAAAFATNYEVNQGALKLPCANWSFGAIYEDVQKCLAKAMDTATYAAIAVLPHSLIRRMEHPSSPEAELLPLNVSDIARSWIWRFSATGSCNDI